MKKSIFCVLGMFSVLNALAQVVPVPHPFYAGDEQTDDRMIYVGGGNSGGRLVVDCHADFSVARDDNSTALNWCNLGSFKSTFGFFGFDGPISEYPLFNSSVNGSSALIFDGDDKLRMVSEPGQVFILPNEITDGVLSVEMWVHNPSVEEDEILIRFEDSLNVDLTSDQFNMSDSDYWQHLVAISNGSQTIFYKNGSQVGTQLGSINLSGNAVINLGAKSLSGSIAALRIHSEQMNNSDIIHNNNGGEGLGSYLFYPINADYQNSCTDVHGDENITTGDPTACSELQWRESAHFRSMWISAEGDMANRVENIQLPQAEIIYTFFNEKSGKHLPFVSDYEHLRGDGRKYKWILGNGSGNYSGWSDPLGLGFGVSYSGYVSFHEYTHGTDNHQLGEMTSQWWETHANYTPSWGDFQVDINPVHAVPKGAHIYPVYGGDYYHDYLMFEHLAETPEFGPLFITRLWNFVPSVDDDPDRAYPPLTMKLCDPSPQSPFSQEWVKVAARNITWDYPAHPEYAEYWETEEYKSHLHYTLLEEVPYLGPGWYEPQKWRAPHQLGYNICPLEVNIGTVTANIDGHIDLDRGSAWSAMFVAVDSGIPRYGNIFTNLTEGNFNVLAGDDELYLVVVATPTNLMECGIFSDPWDNNTDYREENKARFPYQVLLNGTSPKADSWRPMPWIDPSANVDETAYVSPNAYIGPDANILGNARVEDFATVFGTVRDNAVVSDYSVIESNAIIRDNARVTDFARISENKTVENSAHIMEHARIMENGKASDYAVIKGHALVDGWIHGTAIIDGNYIKNGDHSSGYQFLWAWGDYIGEGETYEEFNQLYLEYEFEEQNSFRVWDTHGATWGRLVNGPNYVSDNGSTVLELDGNNDFVELYQSVAQFEQFSIEVDVKWEGGVNDQKLINFSNSETDDEAWLSPSNSEGKLAFIIKVDGVTQVVSASESLPSGVWKNIKLVTIDDKVTILVDGIEWAYSDTITHDIDQISANECYIGRGAFGGNFKGCIDDFTFWTKALVENIPPEPNPFQWLIEPFALDQNNVMMQAVTAFDANPPVEYYFEEISGNPGGSSSGWQTSTLYYDNNLLPGTQYTYKVRARDSQQNSTLFSLISNVTTPTEAPCHFIQNTNGMVSIEAENYNSLSTGSQTGHNWVFNEDNTGFSGNGVMIAHPNSGDEIDENYLLGGSPRMDFNVLFNQPGTHYMHIRGYGSNYNDDACHGGINFQGSTNLEHMAFTPSLEYVWDNHGGSEIVIPYPGIHKINVYMREDGTMIDKIVITDSPGSPSGYGPIESNQDGCTTNCQTLNMPTGWSIFSTYIIPDNNSIQSIIEPIIDNVIIAKNNAGAAYMPEWNFDGIGNIIVGQGYQVKTDTELSLELCGEYTAPEENPIDLSAGWNIVGYLRTEAAASNAVLAEINATGNLIIAKNYNGNAYLPEWNFNGIGDMVPGEGYQIKTNTADVLQYLSNDDSYRMSAMEVTENNLSHYAKVAATDNNMTIVIEDAAWDTLPTKGSEIAAFDKDGNMVGSAIYSSPLTVLTVWGDDHTTDKKDGLYNLESLEFKIWGQSEEKSFEVLDWKDGSNQYISNAINIAGMINTNNNLNSIKLFDAIPNPSENKTNISFYIPKKHKVKIDLYDILGKSIYQITNSEYDAGKHEIEIDVSNLNNGSYFYKMTSGNFIKTNQLVILR